MNVPINPIPIELLNTHADMDHIGSIGEFDRFYMNPAEATNLYQTYKGNGEMIPIWDGDELELGGRKLKSDR